MKRIQTLLPAVCMRGSVLPVTASAAAQTVREDRAAACAEALYDLGLFLGTGTRNDGAPEFDLGSAPNRAQAGRT